MLKLDSLRKTLHDAVPYFRTNPEQIHFIIENGNIVSTLAPSLSHEYRYTMTIIVNDYGGDIDMVTVPILSWLRANQHDGMANRDKRDNAFRFEAYYLNNISCDLIIELAITERVIVKEDDGGVLSVSHVPEPPTPYDNHGPFSFENEPGNNWEV